MRNILHSDICTEELCVGIINHYHEPFVNDYMVLHCLLRKNKIKTVFEVGCNEGVGTKIICNAVPNAKVFSLDLPEELSHLSKQHPNSEGKGTNKVGHLCDKSFTLLSGDSMEFDYSKYPCEAYFVDGEHDIKHVFHETNEILKCNPKLVIYHDADMPEVFTGIMKAFSLNGNFYTTKYEIYRVTDTRMLYALRK